MDFLTTKKRTVGDGVSVHRYTWGAVTSMTPWS